MKILITNDDGIKAPGLVPFVKWAQSLGEVFVVAPKTEQSGKSHGIELRRPFEVVETELCPGITGLSLDSSPADCVRFAVLGLKKRFDLILSGINRGYNLGQDMIYSGTVSAATEGAYQSIPSIALSTDLPAYDENTVIAQLDGIRDYFCRNELLKKHMLYNVNIPPSPMAVKITCQGGVYYTDEFPCFTGSLYKARGRCAYEAGEDLSIDTHCVMNGFTSVTPLATDRTDREIFSSLNKLN